MRGVWRLIELRVDKYTYPNGRVGLSDFYATFEGCDFIIGPTGSGKSTVLKMVNGLIPNFLGGTLEGKVRVFGEKPNPRIAFFVKQNPEEMITSTQVIDELVFPLIQQGFGWGEAKREAEEVCEELGIGGLLERKTYELSTGELQLVQIAAALASKARILVFDEPFANLSRKNVLKVIKILRDYPHLVSEHRLEFSSFFEKTINLGLECEDFEIPEVEPGEAVYDGLIELREGELIALVGDNGAGKTMMLKKIATEMRKLGLDFSIVLQNPSYHLVEDSVGKEVDLETAKEFGIESLLSRHPQSLSMGQMKRVAIAKAFKSKILLLDEPTAGQDCNFRRRLLYLLRKHRKSAIIATHDPYVAEHCDRKVEL
ncbi:ribose ABC transporter, ATP-binding protein (rbsA-2) [Archaeoglobus fulgidus DSM 4304]|jgi:energy-coupling factor transporter ATP-binding protein EcfA2|uniref:Ribose ABC transporter, ATP-binding protein (RbsA-2) n=2 Tax=Archaeoglobus fulgidus TaxID=2234 RepID=O29097_ARCFU|nr:ribose ABC transporter, ATP-binding protein (rbsA-2) [Archaeoglobus fulgidus DSM 4304]AIG98044.1 ABC-type cobalt transport system, ATPase component [Archaeoglobus fulgidus DSM 8774]